MLNSPFSSFATSILLVTALLLSGCNRSSETGPSTESGHDHDHEHALPSNYVSAIAQLQAMHAKIATAFTEGDPDDAHHELHDVGRLIEHLPVLAKESGFPQDDYQQVADASEVLFEDYGKLDTHFHGKEVKYADLQESIDSSFEILVEKRSLAAEHLEGAGDEDHAEGHDDHAGHDEDAAGHDTDSAHEEDHDGDHDGRSEHNSDANPPGPE